MKRAVAAVVFAGLFSFASVIMQPVLNGMKNAYELSTPVAWWYEYESVTLATDGVPKGEVPKFVSDTTYHRQINMRWEDTLWCRQSEGIKKYTTQDWPATGTELTPPGRTLDTNVDGDLPFWEYTAQDIDEDATSCYLEWIAIGVTKNGHEKVTTGQTPWFPVNI